jgi:hypothetical protein
MKRIWFMFVRPLRVRYVQAEAPCWKGEAQVLNFLVGWQLAAPEQRGKGAR